MKTEGLDSLPLPVWILIGATLIAQGTWLFTDARKRDANAWFWGIWGLIQFPLPLIVYWLMVRKLLRKKGG